MKLVDSLAVLLAAPPGPLAPVDTPNYNPAGTPVGTGSDQLLGILAWLATAAGVAGLLTIGMMFALQLRRGEPGEMGEYFRGLLIVIIACLVAASAGPIVAFFGDLSLQ
jgi:hypothetical protein